jgi:uncharacterized protein (DUF305 family)
VKRFIALALAVASGALAASQLAVAAPMDQVGPAGVSIKKAPFDQQFIDQMAVHHQMAIEMAKMALDSAKHAELKTMAKQIIAAQQKEISEFKALRKQWYGSAAFKTYPMDEMMMRQMGMGGMEKMHSMMMSADFDKAFINAMIPHHAGAITMANWELSGGTHAKLKAIASKIISAQAKEIGEMIAMRKSWYGS